MVEAMGIGFFQFDNLVRNRVPFALVNLGLGLDEIYAGVELKHIQQFSLPLELPIGVLDIIVKLQARHYQAQDPVICLCENGQKSKFWADELEKRGFRNCYYVEGGSEGLLKEFRELK